MLTTGLTCSVFAQPLVDLVFLGLSKAAHAIGGHRMLVDPAVNGVTADTEVLSYLVY
jgi:hypothetical protein